MLEPQAMDGSALATRKNQEKEGKDLSKVGGIETQENRGNIWCTYCNKLRRSKEQCWKINGTPPTGE